MVTRMRIYASQQADHRSADAVFYAQVKPVHERHGAIFKGRYRDQEGRVVVLWDYPDMAAMVAIQAAVAADPETLQNRQLRLDAGLHGLEFTEFVLHSTAPEA